MTPERRNELLKLYSTKKDTAEDEPTTYNSNPHEISNEPTHSNPKLETNKKNKQKIKQKNSFSVAARLRDDQIGEIKFLSYEACENMNLYVARAVRMRKLLEAEVKQGAKILIQSNQGTHEINIDYLLAK